MEDTRAWQMEQSVRLADVAPGTRVVASRGMVGRVSETVPDASDRASGVRVAWEDGTVTFVPLRVLEWRNEVLVVMTDAVASTRPLEGAGAPTERAETITVPVIEEQLTAGVVWREAGSVHVRVRAEAVPQTVTREIEHEEVYVEEVAIGRELADGERPAPHQEGDVLVIPIIEEEIVVITRRVLTREVRITRRMARAPQTVDTTTRHTVVEIDPGDLADRVHLATGGNGGMAR